MGLDAQRRLQRLRSQFRLENAAVATGRATAFRQVVRAAVLAGEHTTRERAVWHHANAVELAGRQQFPSGMRFIALYCGWQAAGRSMPASSHRRTSSASRQAPKLDTPM
jgi:hypothetical protein